MPAPILNDPIGHLTTHGAAWKQRDDAERDAWLEGRGIEVWRVDRDTWIPDVLSAQLRIRLG